MTVLEILDLGFYGSMFLTMLYVVFKKRNNMVFTAKVICISWFFTLIADKITVDLPYISYSISHLVALYFIGKQEGGGLAKVLMVMCCFSMLVMTATFFLIMTGVRSPYINIITYIGIIQIAILLLSETMKRFDWYGTISRLLVYGRLSNPLTRLWILPDLESDKQVSGEKSA